MTTLSGKLSLVRKAGKAVKWRAFRTRIAFEIYPIVALFPYRLLTGGAVALVIAFSGSVAFAEDGASDNTRRGFHFNLGAGDIHADSDSAFQKAATREFGLLRARGPWRYGLGVGLGSFGMEPP